MTEVCLYVEKLLISLFQKEVKIKKFGSFYATQATLIPI